jgi:hypothetical protein
MSWQYADPDQRFTGRGYDVQEIDYRTALDYIQAHHYLASMGADVKRYGLFHAGELVGVAVYGNPSNARVLTNWLPDLAPYTQSLTLLRVVLADRVPGNGESWLLRQCRDRLTADGVLGSVTFADPMALHDASGRRVFKGHTGIMYQGDNWTFCGVATARPVLVTATGQRLDARTLQKIRAQESGHEGAERTLIQLGAPVMQAGENPASWLRRALDAIQPRTVRHTGCYRYVRAHRRDVAIVHRGRRVRHDPAAYPKPSDDLMSLLDTDAAASQEEE